MKKKILIKITLFLVVGVLAVNGMRLDFQQKATSDKLMLGNVEQLSDAELVINYNGYVGLFTWNPQYVLQIGETGQSLVAKINGTWVMTSDSRAKENIQDLPDALATVKSLRGVSYNWNTEGIVEPALAGRDVYGFIAEEVREVLPNLVYEDGEGALALDYNGVIPLLTNAIKEQQQQIETLEDQVSSLLALRSSEGTTDVDAVSGRSAALYQNAPNPASGYTDIRYTLPDNTASAFIYIFDMQGKLHKTYTADKSGVLQLKVSDLKAGIYTYGLVVDGNLIGTKKLIITK
jgi:hypothetical protein